MQAQRGVAYHRCTRCTARASRVGGCRLLARMPRLQLGATDLASRELSSLVALRKLLEDSVPDRRSHTHHVSTAVRQPQWHNAGKYSLLDVLVFTADVHADRVVLVLRQLRLDHGVQVHGVRAVGNTQGAQ